MEHYNLTLQRDIGRSRTVEISYVGSRGHDLISARDVNQPPMSPSPFNLRPNPAFADITLIESRASSRYTDALQLRFQQRAEAGLSVLATCTYNRRPTMRPGFSRAREVQIFRRTVSTPVPKRAARRSISGTSCPAAFSWPIPARRRAPAGSAAGWWDRSLSEMDLQVVLPPRILERPPIHRGGAAHHRRQQHRPFEPGLRVQRPPQRDR